MADDKNWVVLSNR